MPDIADTSDSSYVVVSSDGPESNLPNRRIITAGNNISFTDGGAGSTETISANTQNIAFTGVISPPQLTADQNNYNPTGLSTASRIRLDADSSFRTITGLAGGTNGRSIKLKNISANTILLANQNTGSSVGNRFDFAGYDLPLLPSREIEIEYDSTDSRWRFNGQIPIVPTGNLGIHYHNELNGGGSLDGTLTWTAASGGTSAGIVGVLGHPGINRLTMGTSATGSASAITPITSAFLLGNSTYYRYDAIINIDNLSDGTNNYTLRIGFIDSQTAEPVDGVFFRYNHSVNSGKFERVTRSNSVETGSAIDTGTTVAAATWYRLTIIVNPAGTNAEFFINGASVGSNTTNIPTGSGRSTGFGLMFVKTAGTTNNNLIQVDSIGLIIYINTSR